MIEIKKLEDEIERIQLEQENEIKERVEKNKQLFIEHQKEKQILAD